MTPEQRRRVRDTFEAALEQSPAQRIAWISRELSADSVVRAEVLSLLEHDSRAGSFLLQPVIDRVPDLLTDEPFAVGAVVGAYTIVRDNEAAWAASIWRRTNVWPHRRTQGAGAEAHARSAQRERLQ
jgi:hypothetical protein